MLEKKLKELETLIQTYLYYGDISVHGLMSTCKKQYPEKYAQFELQWDNESNPADLPNRQTNFDNNILSMYPEEAVIIGKKDVLLPEYYTLLKGFGMYKREPSEHTLKDVGNVRKAIENSQTKEAIFNLFLQRSKYAAKKEYESLQSFLSAEYYAKQRAAMFKEYLELLKNALSYMEEFFSEVKYTKEVKVGDTVFYDHNFTRKQQDSSTGLGLARTYQEDTVHEVTKMSDKFIYLDGKRFLRTEENIYKPYLD